MANRNANVPTLQPPLELVRYPYVPLPAPKQENLNDPTGFLPNPIPPNYLQKAISTRNDTDHLNLNDIDQKWPTRISSYAALCESINNHGTATEIKTVSNQICAGNLSGIVQFAFSFSWTCSNSQGVGISLIMYAILLRYLGKVVRAFLIGKLGIQNLTLDLHANLKFINDQLLLNPNYIERGWSQRGHASLFQRVFDTRQCYAHGLFLIAWNNWEVQLKSELIFEKLVRCKNEGLVVTRKEFNIMGF